MEIQSKIRALQNAWLDYISLENLCNAQVNALDEERPNIWDKDIRLLGDRLVLGTSLFNELQSKLKPDPHKGKKEELQIAAAFPQLYIISSGSRQFRPLFTINITAIFDGKYRQRGWDLTQFEFQPVLPNLMEWYGIEEEQAESLVTKEGLKVFLETTFHYSFETLQDFVDYLELPPHPIRSKTSPYLLNFGYVPFNHNLKKDLVKIREQPYRKWAVPGHLAYEYLFGTPPSPQPSLTFLGAFPTFPPDDEQATALKHSLSHPLTAVIGPPGNGKTTLLLHQIAQQVVKRAVQSLTEGGDESNLTLVTSTNNRAVENVEALLAEKLDTPFFYLSGGSQELVNTQVFPKLQAAIDYLRETTFHQGEWEAIQEQLLSRVQKFQSDLQQEERYPQQKAADEQLLAQYQGEIQGVTEAINALQNQSSASVGKDYSQFPTEAYEQILPHLKQALQDFPSPPIPFKGHARWWQRLWFQFSRVWHNLTHRSPHQILKHLHQQIEMPILATLATPFPMQMPLTRESLADACQRVKAQLDAAKQWQQQNSPNQQQCRLEALQQKLYSLQTQQQQVQTRLASYPTEDIYTRFYRDYHSLQVELFELSWQWQQQEALRRKDEVIASIQTYLQVLAGEWEAFRRLASYWRKIYRDISLLFPVFLTTLHSLRRLFPYPDYGCIEQVIVDEAGQIPLHQVFPALVRSKRGMIVGDPFQLEPVITLNAQKKEEYQEKAFLARGLTETDFDSYSPTACSAYHRAAGADLCSGELGNPIILQGHYRCVPSIITFCDRLCHYGMRIHTPSLPSNLGTNLLAYHIEDHCSDGINLAEVEKVESVIENLLAAGYCLNSPNHDQTIGVISPYRRQANALVSRLQSRFAEFPSDSVGTVHRFQGGQKSVILLSTRQSKTDDSLWFLNRQPNLLNVAVSRARELFILVGNLDKLSSGGYTKLLVEHIEQFGQIHY